jgi:hypothetical protein
MVREKCAFDVSLVAAAGSVDREAVAQAIADFLDERFGDSVENIGVKAGAVKTFTEQGYKVWRARVTGETAEQAGDSANPKKVKAPNLEAPAEAAAE